MHFIARSSNSKLRIKGIDTVPKGYLSMLILRTEPPCRAAPLIKNNKDVIHDAIDWITHIVLFERYLKTNVASDFQRNKHRSAMWYWCDQLSTKKYWPPSLKLKHEDVKRVKDIKAVGSKTIFDNDIQRSILADEMIIFIDGLAIRLHQASLDLCSPCPNHLSCKSVKSLAS